MRHHPHRVETTSSALTAEAKLGDVLRIPINRFEGNYTCDAATLAALRADDRVVVRYIDNPNGSVDDIAGVLQRGRNVVGLMPHPERACHPLVGSTDGAVLQPLQGIGAGQLDVDPIEPLSHRVGGALATALRLADVECFEIATHRPALIPTFRQRGQARSPPDAQRLFSMRLGDTNTL